MVVAIIFQGNVLRITHLQPVEQLVQRRYKPLIILMHFTRSNHLHHRGEVLFVLRCFIMEIENQRQQKHLRRLIPERVLRLTALGRGVLKQVRHKALDVIIIPQIDKRIVTVAFLHIDEIDYLDCITLGFQQITCIPQKFALWV